MYTISTYDDPVVISASASVTDGAAIWMIIASILSIIGGILIYFLFVNSKTEPKGKFAKILKDFLSFRTMMLEPIVKILYYVATIEVILTSFTFIATQPWMFFFLLILGPVFVRLIYEFFMMLIMIWRNSRDIAENTKKK